MRVIQVAPSERSSDTSQSHFNLSSEVGQRPARRVELLNGVDDAEHRDVRFTLEKNHVAG